MYSNGNLFTLYGLTPVHPGSGSSLSYVDLPVQREKHTSFPVIAGSGLKGVIRDLAERNWNDKNKVNKYFGSADSGDTASLVSFTDAKNLFYPVRSVRGIFAWITCPYVLKRFEKEVKNLGGKNFNLEGNLFNDISDEKAIVDKNSILFIDDKKNSIGLEEFLLTAETKELRSIFKNINDNLDASKIAIVSDNVFTDLVNYAIEVRTRIRIDQNTGTAQSGALFTLELVPSESIFYGFYFLKPERDSGNNNEKKDRVNFKEINELLSDKIIQVGGDETIGCGLMKVNIVSSNDSSSTQSSGNEKN